MNKPEILKDKSRQETVPTLPHLSASGALQDLNLGPFFLKWGAALPIWDPPLKSLQKSSQEAAAGEEGAAGRERQQLSTQDWHLETQEICRARAGKHRKGARRETPSLLCEETGLSPQSLLSASNTQQDRQAGTGCSGQPDFLGDTSSPADFIFKSALSPAASQKATPLLPEDTSLRIF